MPKLEWFIGDLHIKKLKRQETYSVRVRLTDADGNRSYSPAGGCGAPRRRAGRFQNGVGAFRPFPDTDHYDLLRRGGERKR